MTDPGRTAPPITDVEARPIRALWAIAVIGLALLLYGVFGPGDSTPVRTTLLIVIGLSTLLLIAAPIRGRLRVTDGVLTKRALRTTQVDLRDLAAIRTSGDRPWVTNPTGVVRFEDRHGGAVEVPLVSGPWVPTGPLWRTLAVAIETSGLPMSGIVGAQLERYIKRSLRVDDANRAALERCRDELRRGVVTPQETRGGADTAQHLLLAPAVPLTIAIPAAAAGAVPPSAVTAVQVAAGLGVVVLVAVFVGRRRSRLGIDEGAVLRRTGGSEVALGQLAGVDLVPDRPYLETTFEGVRPTGRRAPRLVVRDTAGGSVRIELSGRWRAPVPILRYVLAAAEERGVPLSKHARYELEFYCGLTGRVRYPGDDAART